jgi:hypothetical protein
MAKRQTLPSDFRHTDVHVAVLFVLTKKKPTGINGVISLFFVFASVLDGLQI